MRWLIRVLLAMWLVLVVVGSLVPRVPPAVVVRFPGAGYVAHGVSYAVLCVFAACARRRHDDRALAVTALGAFLLGVVLEFIQPLTGRTFDLGDMAANGAGVATAVAAILLARSIAARRGFGVG
jgi:hypothetical protein